MQPPCNMSLRAWATRQSAHARLHNAVHHSGAARLCSQLIFAVCLPPRGALRGAHRTRCARMWPRYRQTSRCLPLWKCGTLPPSAWRHTRRRLRHRLRRLPRVRREPPQAATGARARAAAARSGRRRRSRAARTVRDGQGAEALGDVHGQRRGGLRGRCAARQTDLGDAWRTGRQLGEREVSHGGSLARRGVPAAAGAARVWARSCELGRAAH